MYLRSVAGFVPDNLYSNEDLCDALGFPADKAAKYAKLLGVRRRPLCVDYRNGGVQVVSGEEMGFRAASAALRKASLTPLEVDAIICCSSFFDYIAPPVSSRLVKRLEIDETFTLDLMGGCAELLHGLKVGADLIRLGEAENVLVTSSEVINAWWRQGRYPIEYFIFGDTGGAVVLSASSGSHLLRGVHLRTRSRIMGEPAELIRVPILGGKEPAPLFYQESGLDELVRTKSEIPATHRLVHSIKQVALGAPAAMIESTRHVMARAEVDPRSVYLVPHQASSGVLAALTATGVPSGQIAVSLPDRGNMSTSSVPVALDEHWEEAGRHRNLVFTSVGVGMSFGAMLFESV